MTDSISLPKTHGIIYQKREYCYMWILKIKQDIGVTQEGMPTVTMILTVLNINYIATLTEVGK